MAGSLDQATMQRIADRQGVQLTPENARRISEFAAANPDVLERYSMGTAAPTVPNASQRNLDIAGGTAGTGDNSSLLSLVKYIDTQAGVPQGSVEVGQPQMAAPAPARARPAPQGRRGTNAIVEPNLADPDLNKNVPVNPTDVEPRTGYNISPDFPTILPYPSNTPSGPSTGGSFLDWLWPAILGGSGGAAAAWLRGNRGGATSAPATPEATFAGRIPTSGDPTVSGPTQRIPQQQNAPVPPTQNQVEYQYPRPAGATQQPTANPPDSSVRATAENQRALPQPDRKIENQRSTTVGSSPETEAASRARAERDAAVANEVAIDNARNQALMEQMRNRANTQELSNAARAATRARPRGK